MRLAQLPLGASVMAKLHLSPQVDSCYAGAFRSGTGALMGGEQLLLVLLGAGLGQGGARPIKRCTLNAQGGVQSITERGLARR
jgi:hypothetical protein